MPNYGEPKRIPIPPAVRVRRRREIATGLERLSAKLAAWPVAPTMTALERTALADIVDRIDHLIVSITKGGSS